MPSGWKTTRLHIDNVRALVGVSSNASVFAMARDSADIQLNIGAEVAGILD